MRKTTDTAELSLDELSLEQLDAVSGGDQNVASAISNLANMRHEMLKAVANNLRA